MINRLMKQIKLQDVCIGFTKNIALKDLTNNNGIYPLFGASGYLQNVDFAICDREYIGIVKDGAGVGRTNIYPAHSSLLGTMQYIYPLEGTDILFLKYAIQHLHLGDSLSGATIPHIYWSDYKNCLINYYVAVSQKEIGAILINIDKAIVLLKQKLVLLDELVKSQFIEMFGEDGEKGNCVTKSLQQLLDDGWITYHLDGNHGGDYPRADEFVESGVPYISANCIVNDRIDMSLSKYVTSERAKRFRKGIAMDGDVLFAHNATVGPVAILETDEPTVILGTSLTSYRCNRQHILSEYLITFMQNPLFVQQYERNMQQSTRKQVPITTQRKYNFIIPSLEEQNEFAKFVRQSDKSKFIIQQQIKDLNELFESKMDEYFN